MVTARQEANFSKRVGQSIAKQRQSKELTQEQVALAIGVEQETISRFERGATLPSLSRLMDIAEFLDVPLDALVRAGSSRPLDLAVDISVMLSMLKDEDKVWVRDWMEQLCKKLLDR